MEGEADRILGERMVTSMVVPPEAKSNMVVPGASANKPEGRLMGAPIMAAKDPLAATVVPGLWKVIPRELKVSRPEMTKSPVMGVAAAGMARTRARKARARVFTFPPLSVG